MKPLNLLECALLDNLKSDRQIKERPHADSSLISMRKELKTLKTLNLLESSMHFKLRQSFRSYYSLFIILALFERSTNNKQKALPYSPPACIFDIT